jgi:hypothetical protein
MSRPNAPLSTPKIHCLLSRYLGIAFYSSALLAFVIARPSSGHAQVSGYLGYVANTSDGSVSIFATETAAATGNNDRLLATVPLSSTAQPQRIAVDCGASPTITCNVPGTTPDVRFAFVSSPADKTIYQIDVSNPSAWSNTILSPPFGVTVATALNASYTPGSIAVTYQNATASPPNTEFYVWVTDSSNCEMHVYSFNSSSPAPLGEVSGSPITITLQRLGSSVALSCPSGGLLSMPEIAVTPDGSALYATFNGVNESSTSTPDGLIVGFNPGHVGESPCAENPSCTEGIAYDPETIGFGLRFITIGPSGGPFVLMGSLTSQGGSDSGGVGSLALNASNPAPTSLSLNDGDATIEGVTSGGSTVGDFSLYAAAQTGSGASTKNVVFITPVGPEGIDEEEGAVSFQLTPSGESFEPLLPSFLSMTPDPDGSLVYVSSPSLFLNSLVLLRTNIGDDYSDVCVAFGLAGDPLSCSSTVTSSAGAELYPTTVSLGNHPTGLTFSPISTTSGVISWFTGYSLTGGTSANAICTPSASKPCFLPFPGAPTVANATPPNYKIFPPQSTLTSNIRIQSIGMVNAANTWNGTPGVKPTGTNSSNYGCTPSSSTSSSCTDLANGLGAQPADFNISGGGGSVGYGDTTIIGQPNQCTSGNCNGSTGKAQNGFGTATQIACRAGISVNNGQASSSSVSIRAGLDQIAGQLLDCLGAMGDHVAATINWGDGTQSKPDLTTIPTFQQANATTPQNSSPGIKPTYTSIGTFGVSFSANDVDGGYTITPANNIIISVTVGQGPPPVGPISPTITVDQRSATVVPGQSAPFHMHFAGNTADAGAVFKIACQGLPPGSACSYSPNPFPLGPTGLGDVTLTISTTGPGMTASIRAKSPQTARIIASALGLTWIAGLFFLQINGKNSDRKKGVYSLLLVLLLGFTVVAAVSCGTNVSSSSLQLPCSGCTPVAASPYVVTVSATSQQPALQAPPVLLQLQVVNPPAAP